ncbi:uncharacterized protein LOC122079619 [Macadamia integrifolia]|uniref:uncharacterized protein LOC122079619 n=1 Tax=Macadamia integrifolia TaxID=60698 RepID=UPI001C4F3232|nr:uncharacterized protein LOC122079619 [Macadamia integrifolia]
MGHSLSPSSPFLSADSCCHLRRCEFSNFFYFNPVTNFQMSRHRRRYLSVSVDERKLEASWLFPDGKANDDYGGWAISTDQDDEKKGLLPPFLLVGIGTSIVILLSAFAHRSLTRKGFKFPLNIQMHALQGMLKPSEPKASEENLVNSWASPEASDEISETQAPVSIPKLERVVVPVAVDSAQQEALLLLKKLKIIEDDVKADELCTRREYARWLVRANSLLERDPKHRVVPSVLLAGSHVCAFDNISIEDPDFHYIQALAEAGIVLSKLSGSNNRFSDQDGFKGQEEIHFFPDRFISRLDLIDWKAQLEYSSIERIEKKISRTELGFMDVKEIKPDTTPGLYLDILAGDKGILRKVFGQIKRLQPGKPVTKAQAAVTLTSGRMTEAIHSELSRIEAENTLRMAEMEQIKIELLGKGEIQKFWEEKMNEEKARGVLMEKDFLGAVHDLEQEKIVQDKNMARHLKEKAALDCQRQLLSSLKEEVNEMSERLGSDKTSLMAEKQTIEDMLNALQANQEAIVDAKSILEAEIEALQILRSWVEDEAKKNQARAKVLEEVGRRWKWDDQASL